MIPSSVSNIAPNTDNLEFKKAMVLLEKAGKDKDSRLAGSLTK